MIEHLTINTPVCRDTVKGLIPGSSPSRFMVLVYKLVAIYISVSVISLKRCGPKIWTIIYSTADPGSAPEMVKTLYI